MIFKFIRSIREGHDDAKAAIARPKFLASMSLIESLDPVRQDVIAELVERAFMKDIPERYSKYLPENFRQEKDYLQFANSKNLQRLSDHFFKVDRNHNVSFDSKPNGAGVATLELVGYYLLSRSWQNLDHSINLDAPELGASMIGLEIETRIHEFLKKQGRSLPRSC